MKRIAAIIGLALFVWPAVASAGEGDLDLSTAALVVIDVQAFYFEGGSMPLVEPEAAAGRAARLVSHFRKNGRPVIHVQHLPKGVEEADPTGVTEQYRIHPKVLPLESEIVIGKHHANSFRGTSLLETLRSLEVQTLLVSGMQTHMCVEAAVRAAADLGFNVVVVHDACATRDLEFGGTVVPAVQVHAAALAAMGSGYARVVGTDEVCAAKR